ncbi:MAG: TIGR03915 family putative DNA repair protein [Clostridia bacterium]|nr:TIGR03915 family putative DNA repair protein [Clostridia bacterium]
MIAYKFDGTIDGLFSCVYNSFVLKEIPYLVADGDLQLLLDGEVRNIKTDHEANKRIITALYNYIGFNALSDIKFAFRSGNENKSDVIFRYIRRTFECRKNISGKFSEKIVMDFYDLVKQVSNEVHRMKGFVRFSECADTIMYARFSPDNDITDLLMPHFTARFKNMPFVIHDVSRGKVAMFNGSESKILTVDSPFWLQMSEQERTFQSLWRTYYNSVNIKERKNDKLMRSFLPTRYHKHLTELHRVGA